MGIKLRARPPRRWFGTAPTLSIIATGAVLSEPGGGMIEASTKQPGSPDRSTSMKYNDGSKPEARWRRRQDLKSGPLPTHSAAKALRTAAAQIVSSANGAARVTRR